jgi:hypothetical protein
MSTSTSQEHQHAPDSTRAAVEAATSTLIEFPGVPPKPQWRKELSERVREIQQRRALEAEREAEATTTARPSKQHVSGGAAGTHETTANASATVENSAPPLGLVPAPPDAPKPNPLVVAALKRIERAHQQAAQQQPMPRSHRGGGAAATAVARVAEENYQASIETGPCS